MALEDSNELYLPGNDIRNTPCFNDYKHAKILRTVHFNQIMILNSVEINFRAHRVFNKIVISETFSKKKSEIWFAISIVIISMWWTHQTVSRIQKLGTYFNVHTEIKKKNSWTNSYLRLWFTQGPNQWAKIYRTHRRTDYYCGTKKPLCSCLASTSCKSAMSHRIACQ